MSRRRIALCYFAPATDYVPLDLGYACALMRQADEAGEFEVEIVPLRYRNRRDAERACEDVRADCAALVAGRHDAVILFCENVQWSKVLALKRALEILAELRRDAPETFLGLQSFKIQPSQVARLLDEGLADCVVTGDPEVALPRIGDVLARRSVPGVALRGAPAPVGCEAVDISRRGADDELDVLPSPYLEHVFDADLRRWQSEQGGAFRAFLTSSRGCSYGCHYCFRSVKFDRVRLFSAKRFFDELEYLHRDFGVWRFFVLDDAFLYSKPRLQAFAEEFRLRKERNPSLAKIRTFMMSRPEPIDEEVVGHLAALQAGWIQVGLQTTNPELQRYMNRRMPVERLRSIASWLRERRIGLFLDLILGLPGDSIEGFRASLEYALSLRPAFMQVKQLYLNPNTRFFVERGLHGIEVEPVERDFDAPHVVRAAGVDERYLQEAAALVEQAIEAHPEIGWKVLLKDKRIVTCRYRAEQSSAAIAAPTLTARSPA